MTEFETVTIADLDDLVLTINTFLEGCNQDGVSGKFTASQLATLLAPYVVAVGGSSFVPTTGSAMPTAGAGKFTFLTPKTYTQTTGGSLTPTGILTLAVSSATTWTLSSVIIDSITGAPKQVQNLYYPLSSGVQKNTSLGGDGAIVTGLPAVGYAVSAPILVTPGAQYTLSGPTDTYGRAIQFQNTAGVQVGSLVATSYPYTFTVPANSDRLIFTCKLSIEGPGLPDMFLMAVATDPIRNTETVGGANYLYGGTNRLLTADNLKKSATIRGASITNSIDLEARLGNGLNLYAPLYTIADYSLGLDGTTQPQTGAAITGSIKVDPLTNYVLSGISGEVAGAQRAIRFENTAGANIGVAIATQYPFYFTTPANTFSLVFTSRLATQPVQPNLKLAKYTANPLGLLPYSGRIVCVYGDSISNDYPIYNSLLKYKLNASSVLSAGQSGASFAGALQTTALLNAAGSLGANDSLFIMGSVNDFRSSEQPGTISSASGSATMVGGMKKIIEFFQSRNSKSAVVGWTSTTFGDVKLLGYPDSFDSSQVNLLGKYLPEYVDLQRQVFQMYGVHVVDMTSMFGAKPKMESIAAQRRFTRDGVHPSDDIGYPKFTDILARAINNIPVFP